LRQDAKESKSVDTSKSLGITKIATVEHDWQCTQFRKNAPGRHVNSMDMGYECALEMFLTNRLRAEMGLKRLGCNRTLETRTVHYGGKR
jgi:hypothetical protein